MLSANVNLYSMWNSRFVLIHLIHHLGVSELEMSLLVITAQFNVKQLFSELHKELESVKGTPILNINKMKHAISVIILHF